MGALPILSVSVDAKSLFVSLARTGQEIWLANRGVWESASSGAPIWRGKTNAQILSLPRFDGAGRDRLFRKLVAVDAKSGREIQSRWTTELGKLPRATHPIPWPKGKKGVQCVTDLTDAVALGTRHVGLNLSIRELLLPPPGTPTESVSIDGATVAIHRANLARYDSQVRDFARAGMNVTVIVLNLFPRDAPDGDPLIHPKCDRRGAINPLSAFHLGSEESARLFVGLLQFLAGRWSDSVSGFILGNEVQSHFHWHNLGRASETTVIREYHDTLRLGWLAVKSAHADLRVYTSFDYYWTERHGPPDQTMPGRSLLDGVNSLAKAEGDFDFHIAHHPYPQGLVDPVFWDDEDAGLGFDTPIVTFRNLEVLTQYLEKPEQKIHGNARRVILSEQGFNCRNGDENTQAAAFARAFTKVSAMPGIDALILHRHRDHPDEGGLKLGLLDLNGRRRPMWEVFRAAETPDWERAVAPLLATAGLSRWSDALPTKKKLPERSGVGFAPPYDGEIVWSGVKEQWTAKITNALDWRAVKEPLEGGKRAAGLFLHPTAKGDAEALFSVSLPTAKRGERLVLRFATRLTGPQPAPHGVAFSAAIDGEVVFSQLVRDSGKSRPASVDLTRRAGKTVELALRTNAQGDQSFAWAVFLAPAILRERR